MSGILNFMLPGSDPNQPNTFIQNPAQVTRQQQLADALMQQGDSYAPVQSPWQGAARLGQALAGAIGNYRSMQSQRLGQANAAADFGNAIGMDPGQQAVAATPGRTTTALQDSDARNDAMADAQGGAPNTALAAALGGGGAPPAASGNAALAAALGGAPATGGDMAPYQAAISKIESGGNYAAIGPQTSSGDRAYGKYQVMGANIPQWTQAALGRAMTPQEFLATPQAQDAVFNNQFGGYVQQYGPQNAASMWLTGRTLANGGAGATDQNGTNGQAYAEQFTRNLGGAPASAAINAASGDWRAAAASVGITPAQMATMTPSEQQQFAQFAAGRNSPIANTPTDGNDALNAITNNYAKDVPLSAVAPSQPSPAQGAGAPAPGGPQGAGAAPGNAPAPSQANLATLAAAMQPQQPQGGGGLGLIGSANAAPSAPQMDPRLAQAAALNAPLPAASPAPAGATASPPAATPAPAMGALPPNAQTAAPPSASAPVAPQGIHPNMAALMSVLSDPWATPAQQQIASALISAQMPTPPTFGVIGKDVAGNEQYGWINPKTQSVTPLNSSGAMPGSGGPLTPVGADGAPTAAASPGAPGSPVEGASANGMTPQGAAYLNQMEAQGGAAATVARNARAIINGQAPLPESTAATKPIDIAVRDAVLRAAPTFNSATAAAKTKAVSDFSNGDSPTSAGGLVRNLNTALGHLGRLSDSSEALGGADTSIPGNDTFNWARNHLTTGPAAVALSQYHEDVQHFVEEATKFYQGSAGTQFDREKALENLSPDKSPTERRAAIAELSQLMQTKGQELQRNWHQAAPGAADYPIYGPEATAAISRVQGRAPGAQTVPVTTVQTPADVAKLPSGTRFVIPDGSGRIGVAP